MFQTLYNKILVLHLHGSKEYLRDNAGPLLLSIVALQRTFVRMAVRFDKISRI